MNPVLRLYEDVLSKGAEMSLSALPRMIFVVHGAVATAGRLLREDEVWSGEGAASLKAGADGATAWRWELAPGDSVDAGKAAARPSIVSRAKLSARLDTLPAGALLLRGDSVAFPAGGCAYLHRHQGPGIRCLIEGGLRIDTRGGSTSYGPGGAWYESGPEPVFAQAADRPTRFIRVMILPLALLGKSSVEYLNEEDKAKPKSQKYKIYVDMPIEFAAAQRRPE
ncbi:MAG TPA: hypothetical protein VK430_07775 [Xanthobacteraceae bacterium]|nr:hypothetical protein [Xanthobacteraceae bacterium]